MGSRPNIIRPQDTDDQTTRELLREAESSWYGDAAFFGAMAHRPEIFKNIVTMFESFGQGTSVDLELLELMRIKVAELHQCAYCATVRTVEVRNAVKPKENAIFGDIDEDRLTDREYLAVSLAEEISEDPHKIRENLFDDLQGVFAESEIVELLLFASLEVGLDRFCIALELQPTDNSAYPDHVEYPMEDPRPKTE
jgi:alkylhydroperoxidase family enzyme